MYQKLLNSFGKCLMMSDVINVANIWKNFRKIFPHSRDYKSDLNFGGNCGICSGKKLMTGFEKLNVRCVSSVAQRNHMKQVLKRLWRLYLPLGPAWSNSTSMSWGSKRFLLSEFQLCYFWKQVMKQCEMYLVYFRDYLLVTNPTSCPSTPHSLLWPFPLHNFHCSQQEIWFIRRSCTSKETSLNAESRVLQIFGWWKDNNTLRFWWLVDFQNQLFKVIFVN